MSQLLYSTRHAKALFKEASQFFTWLPLSSFEKAEEAQPRALICKLWVFMLLWISLIFQACLLEYLYYQKFKNIRKCRE